MDKKEHKDPLLKPLCAPPVYKEAFETYAKEVLADIETLLPLSLYMHDHDRLKLYVAQLNDYLGKGYPLPTKNRLEITKTVYQALADPSFGVFDINLQIKIMQAITKLIKSDELKRYLAKQDSKFDGLKLDWKPLYKLYVDVHLQHNPLLHLNYLKGKHMLAWHGLVTKARRYFTPNAAQEILDTLLPDMNPRDSKYISNLALLGVFLPTNNKEWLAEHVPSLLQMTNWNSRYARSTCWWLAMIARVAYNAVGVIDWNPYLPKIFNAFLNILNLNVGGQQSPLSSRNEWNPSELKINQHFLTAEDAAANAMAKFVVYSLHKESSTIESLAQLFQTTSTYFHPSNTGSWTIYLSTFLKRLASFYAKRLGKEIRGEADYPEKFFLDAKDTKFATLLQPMAMQAIFSKSSDMVTSAELCLKNLASYFPQLILPSLFQEIYSSFEDVRYSHRTMSSFRAVAAVAQVFLNRKLYPEGHKHLSQLLWASLPGIDATDPQKTTRTLNFLSIVLDVVPIFEGKAEKKASKENNEEDEEARLTTLRFGEWSEAFLARVLKVIETMDKFSKSSMIDISAVHLTFKAVRSFFNSLSNELYAERIKQLSQAVIGVFHLNAIKYFGTVVQAACPVNPAVSLPLFIPTIYKKIVEKDEKGETRLASWSDAQINWFVYILSQAVQWSSGKKDLLPYIKQLEDVYVLVSAHKDKSIRKNAGKLLKNILRSLSMVYNIEERNADPSHWEKEQKSGDWKHWQEWGVYGELLSRETPNTKLRTHEINIQWHVPTQEELKIAERLINTHLTRPVAVLDKFIKGEFEEAKESESKMEVDKEDEEKHSLDEKVARATAAIISIVRGSSLLLGPLAEDGVEVDSEEPEKDLSDDLKTFEGVRCPYRSHSVPSPLPHFTIQVNGKSQSIRSYIANILDKVMSYIIRHSLPYSKSIKKLVKLANFVLCSFGLSGEKVTRMNYWLKFTRKVLAEHRTGLVFSMRPLLVQKEYIRFEKRLHTRTQPYNNQARTLVEHLIQFSVNEFEEVQKKAGNVLSTVLSKYPAAVTKTLGTVAAKLADLKASEQTLKAIVTVLSGNRMRGRGAGKLNRLKIFIQALVEHGEQHKVDQVQILLHKLFVKLLPDIQSSPLQVLLPDAKNLETLPKHLSSILTAQRLKRRQQAIQRFNDTLLRTYRSIISFLLTNLNKEHLHWRYQLISSSFLYVLLSPHRRQVKLPEEQSENVGEDLYHQAVVFFTRGLNSELIPLRNLSIIALEAIFTTHRRAPATDFNHILISEDKDSKTEFSAHDLTSIIDDKKKWSETAPSLHHYVSFLDAQTLSALGVKETKKISSTRVMNPFQENAPLSPKTLSAVEKIIKENLSAIVRAILSNHPSLQTVEGMSQNHGSKGAGDEIYQLIKQRQNVRYKFFYTRVHKDTAHLNIIHVRFLKNIVYLFPSLLTQKDGLIDEFKKLASKQNEKEEQATAAEVFAAVGRALRHLDLPTNQQVTKALESILLSTLENCHPESLGFWSDSLRYVFSNSHPLKTSWLARLLIKFCFARLPDDKADEDDILSSTLSLLDSPSQQSKRIRFMSSLFQEWGWRSTGLIPFILNILNEPPYLHHPYKQVREEVGRLVAILIRNSHRFKADGKTITISYSEDVKKFLQTFTALLQSASNRLDLEKESEEKKVDVPTDEQSQKDKCLLETGLTTIVATLVDLDSPMLTHVLSLLPHSLKTQHHPDNTTTLMAKHCNHMVAFSTFPAHSLESFINMISDVLQSVSWHTRSTALHFLQIFIPRHSQLFTVAQVEKLFELVLSSLKDSHVTVRLSARDTLTSFLTCFTVIYDEDNSDTLIHPSQSILPIPTISLSYLQEKFQKLSNLKLKLAMKRKSLITDEKEIKSEENKRMLKRHSGVLGLSSIILAHPYDVPSYLPSILAHLSKYVHDPRPISDHTKKLFASFRRTHQDQWHIFKLKFTEEELEQVNDVTLDSSYFA